MIPEDPGPRWVALAVVYVAVVAFVAYYALVPLFRADPLPPAPPVLDDDKHSGEGS